MRVPEHCSVIGVRMMIAASALCTPPLTTVRQPHGGDGCGSGRLSVIEGIKSCAEKREVGAHHRKVAPELVVRDSTRSLL